MYEATSTNTKCPDRTTKLSYLPKMGDLICADMPGMKQNVECGQFCKELYTLGQCEHRFCRLCAENGQGKMCFVCKMPSNATELCIDKQLSNMASLCLQMSDLLDGKHMVSDAEKTVDQASTTFTPTTSVLSRNKKGKCEASLSIPQRRSLNNGRVHSAKTPKGDEIEKCKSGGRRTRSLSSGTIKKSGNSNEKKSKKYETKGHSKVEENKLASPDLQQKPVASLDMRKPNRQVPQDERQLTLESPGNVSTPKTSHVREKEIEMKNKRSVSGEKRRSKSYLSKRNAKGETPLQVATIKADVETVRNLLEEGANPNVRDNAGWTPLHEAVNHGNATIAELLINYGASVNAPGLDNDTPLHDAVSNYRLDCVRLLMSKGANALARNINGHTPLDQAQTDEMREILLAASATPSHTSESTAMVDEVEDQQQPLCFLGTALTKDQQLMLQKCAKILHSKVVDEFSLEVTHLVTGINAEGMCPRTLKYLNAVMAGRWIVSAEWLSSCLEMNRRVPEEAFEVAGCTSNAGTMAPKAARQNRRCQLPGLFDGCQFYFHGKFSFPTPTREELIGLVKLAGGTILTREPRLYSLDDYPYTVPFHALPSSDLADCSIFVVYDDICPDPPFVEAQRMSCLPVSWLMDSAASFSLQNKTVYSK